MFSFNNLLMILLEEHIPSRMEIMRLAFSNEIEFETQGHVLGCFHFPSNWDKIVGM